LSQTSTFLVSCPKGQVEKYVNVEACGIKHQNQSITTSVV